MEIRSTHMPAWSGPILKAAAVYNVLWGAAVILFPNFWFDILGLTRPVYPTLWQCIGMIVGVFGVGYWIAASDPARHWPIILVGLLGKIFGPIGFIWALMQGDLPIEFGWTIISNDIIWWLPFGLILFHAARVNQDDGNASAFDSAGEAMRATWTTDGQLLAEVSNDQPVMLVFLRHFGCTFCIETVKMLARHREQLDQTGVRLVMVHMSPPERGDEVFEKHGLLGVDHVSDPERRLYRTFGLTRGNLGQVFGPKVWIRGLVALIRTGQAMGRLEGDGFQMPGTVVIYRERILLREPHDTAADLPDYVDLARQAARQVQTNSTAS